MKTFQDIIHKITKLTNLIRTNYPELYVLLDENPMTIPSHLDSNINKNTMEDYLESLKQIVAHYIPTHKNP